MGLFGKKEGNDKNRNLRKEISRGRGVSLTFFRKHAWIILFLTVAVLMLTGLRYKTKTHIMEIERLNERLEQAEHMKMEEKSTYMSLVREKEMVKRVEEDNLGLEFQQQPPYIIQKEDK
jgi:hypothetical protein